MKLTAQAVQKLRHQGKHPLRDVKDNGARGLYLRIWQSGEKRWILRYKIGGRTRIGMLGDARDLSLAVARAKAFQWRAIIREGRDPADENRRQQAAEKRLPTLAAVASEYIEQHAKPNKRSWREDQRLLHREVLPALGILRMDMVQRRDIVPLLDAIRDRGADVLANRVLSVTRQVFTFAVERGVIENSPFSGIRASRETPRARTLCDDELRRLWVATAPGSTNIEPSTRMALRLLLLTGARASEVCGASWDEIKTETAEWVIPATRTKNEREHRIPLSDPAIEVVAEAGGLRTGAWLLPAARGAAHVTIWGVLDAMQRILDPSVTVHDIRRSVATGLQRLDVRLEVTESVLNHVSGSRSGVVGIYQRHDWHKEKRAALDAWSRHILALAAGELARDNVATLVQVA